MTKLNLFTNPEPSPEKVTTAQLEDLMTLQSRILALASSTDKVNELLEQLCILAENLTPDSVASIMSFDRNNEKLYVQSAPSIPKEAIDDLNGLAVGSGSCGNAVYHQKPMYIENTSVDERWCDIRDFAKDYSIMACWSVPVFDGKNEIYGTFAISSFVKRKPTNFQRKLLDTCAHIAGILLQKEEYRNQAAQIEKDEQRIAKLESVGLLAGGIAHDFNNLISIIQGNLELIQNFSTLDANAARYTTSAITACDRAADLTQQLLTFAKGGEPVKSFYDLRGLVKESSEFVLHGSGVAINFACNSIEKNGLVAEIDEGQISQVIQNIIINARQAMTDSGIINIVCDTVVFETKTVNLSPGKYHKIMINNSGPAISEDIIDKIFDPYFTTKETGSGLGLALSHSIMQKHKGSITIQNEENGPTFNLFIPASSNNVNEVSSIKSVKSEVIDKGTVMVMDDEDLLYEMSSTMLEILGYKAVHAKGGAEALALYKAAINTVEPIKIVIMDLTIPGGKGGEDTIKELLLLDPEANVIVSSGYSSSAVMSKFADYGFKSALNKPFKFAELEEALKNIL